MNEMSRGIMYWKNKVMETTGTLMVVTIGLSLIFGLSITPDDYASQLVELIRQFPYIFNLTGGFALLILIASMFQGQFSILLSLNCRRRALLFGVIGFAAAMIAVMLLVSFIIWGVLPPTRSPEGLSTIPLFLGIMLMQFGASLLCGCASVKWGTLGTIVTIVLIAAVGAVYGGYGAYSVMGEGSSGIGPVFWQISFNSANVLLAGGIMTAAGIAASVLTIRRMEVCV